MNSLLAVVLLLATEPPQTIETDLHEQTVVATGLTPGREAVMLAVGRESRGLVGDQLFRYSGGALADAQGRARFTLARPLPQRSLWVVVDRATGRLAMGTPEGARAVGPIDSSGSRTRGRTQFGASLHWESTPKAPAGELTEPDAEGWRTISFKKVTSVELLLIRPGEGVWHAAVADGSRADSDRLRNHKISVAASSLTQLGSGSVAVPQVFQAGDRVLAINPLGLVHRLIEVP